MIHYPVTKEGIVGGKQATVGLEENKYQPEYKSREGDARWSCKGTGPSNQSGGQIRIAQALRILGVKPLTKQSMPINTGWGKSRKKYKINK